MHYVYMQRHGNGKKQSEMTHSKKKNDEAVGAFPANFSLGTPTQL